MRDALQLQVFRTGGAIVEQEHSAVSVGKEMLQGEDLTTVTKRIPSEQPDLREGVEDNSARLHALHLMENVLGCILELDLGRMEGRVLIFWSKTILSGGILENCYSFE